MGYQGGDATINSNYQNSIEEEKTNNGKSMFSRNMNSQDANNLKSTQESVGGQNNKGMGMEEGKSPSQTGRGQLSTTKQQQIEQNRRVVSQQDQTYVPGLIEPNKPIIEYENLLDGHDQNGNLYGNNSLI